jgi:hypothetical protein
MILDYGIGFELSALHSISSFDFAGVNLYAAKRVERTTTLASWKVFLARSREYSGALSCLLVMLLTLRVLERT